MNLDVWNGERNSTKTVQSRQRKDSIKGQKKQKRKRLIVKEAKSENFQGIRVQASGTICCQQKLSKHLQYFLNFKNAPQYAHEMPSSCFF